MHLDLAVRGWEILSAYPLLDFELKRAEGSEAKGPSKISVANLGIVGKMTGAAAIISADAYIDRGNGRLRVWTSCKVLGTFGEFLLLLFFSPPFSLLYLSIFDT